MDSLDCLHQNRWNHSLIHWPAMIPRLRPKPNMTIPLLLHNRGPLLLVVTGIVCYSMLVTLLFIGNAVALRLVTVVVWWSLIGVTEAALLHSPLFGWIAGSLVVTGAELDLDIIVEALVFLRRLRLLRFDILCGDFARAGQKKLTEKPADKDLVLHIASVTFKPLSCS